MRRGGGGGGRGRWDCELGELCGQQGMEAFILRRGGGGGHHDCKLSLSTFCSALERDTLPTGNCKLTIYECAAGGLAGRWNGNRR